MSASEDARKNQEASLTRTQREEAKLLLASGKTTPKPKPKPKKKPKEKRGLGKKDTTSIDRSIEGVKEQLRNAGKTKDLAKARDLAGRLKALKDIRDSDA